MTIAKARNINLIFVSPGAMGGMAFGMLVLGVLLGLGVVFALKKLRGGAGPLSFANKNFSNENS